MRILFIGTDASVSGAPHVLEHFESHFAAQPGIRIGTLLLRAGPRLAQFKRLGPTVFLSRRMYAIPYRVKRLRALVVRTAARRAIGRLRAIDLIFVNTLCTQGVEGPVITGARCTVVTHSHELRHVFDREADVAAVEWLVARSALVFVPSTANANFLTSRFTVDPDKIVVSGEPIDTAELGAAAAVQPSFRAELSIPESAVVVAGSGSLEWAKGPDHFVRLASRLIRTRNADEPEVHLVWFGGYGLALADIIEEAHKLGLAHRLHFIGTRPDARLLFPQFDVFALTSREDSFALVMLEAAAAGLPVVAFESSGGAPEFLAEGAGITVPYGDVEQMAEAVARLIDDAEMRDVFCRNGRERVARFDRSVVAANIDQRLQAIPAMQASWPRGTP